MLHNIEKWVDRYPDKLLFSFLDARGGPVTNFSYQGFWRRVSLLASHLSDRRGLRPGDRVLLAYPAGLEMICALFACTRVGLIPVPTAAPAAYGFASAVYRMAHIAQDCQAVALLTNRDCWDQLRRKLSQDSHPAIPSETQLLVELPTIITEELVGFADSVPEGRTCDIFLLQYTSGSTSSPKGVIVTHENVMHNCRVVDHEAPCQFQYSPLKGASHLLYPSRQARSLSSACRPVCYQMKKLPKQIPSLCQRNVTCPITLNVSRTLF